MLKVKSKVSVIIPVYNVREYLERCVASVVGQTYREIEIILVDDGSTDGSQNICDRWQGQDSRIIVIHKKNGGLSDARNVALKYVKGEFIYYLDSDDYIDNNTIQLLLDEQKRTDADIIISNFYYTYSDHEDIANSFYKEKTILNNYDSMKALVSGKLETFAWGKLIRTNIAKKHLFPKGKKFEDHYWTHYVFGESSRIVFIPNPVVHYRQRDNSISYTYDLKRLDILEGWINRKDYLEMYYPNLKEDCMHQYAERYVGIAWQILTRMKKRKQVAFQKMRLLNSMFQLQNYASGDKRKLICALDKSSLLYAMLAVVYRIRGGKDDERME